MNLQESLFGSIPWSLWCNWQPKNVVEVTVETRTSFYSVNLLRLLLAIGTRTSILSSTQAVTIETRISFPSSTQAVTIDTTTSFLSSTQAVTIDASTSFLSSTQSVTTRVGNSWCQSSQTRSSSLPRGRRVTEVYWLVWQHRACWWYFKATACLEWFWTFSYCKKK